MTQHDTGLPVQLLDYYPFGEIRVSSTTGGFNEVHKFIGEEYDEESEMSYLNARYLQNETGQFVSSDPVFWEDPLSQNLRNPQTLNSYSYGLNNPLLYRDPEGRAAIAVAPAAYLFAGAVALLWELYDPDSLQTGTLADPDALPFF